MKHPAIFLALILLIPFAYAETQIFSGKVITGADKTIDGGTFRFTYDENSRKAFVQTPAGGLIVDNGACKPNSVFRICINSANFSHKDVDTYVFYYEIDATIYKLTGSLSAGSKATLASLLQNEPTEITVTITNPTDFEITNILLSYDLTPFSAISSKGCELNGNILQWKGSLQSKYDKTCTVTVYSGNEGKYSLSGNLSYFNGLETEKKTTDALPITVLPKQLKVSRLLDKDIEVKNPFYLNISLQNSHSSEEISGYSTIILPSHVSLIKEIPAFEKNAKTLRRSILLKPNTGINYSFYLEKSSEGNEPVKLKFSYAIKNVNEEIENSTFVDAIASEPSIKAAEPEVKQEKIDETNLTEKAETQNTQAIAENSTESRIAAANASKTEQPIAETMQKPKFFNKNILLLGISIAVAFLIVLFTVFKMKGKRKDDAMEKLKEELKNNEIK